MDENIFKAVMFGIYTLGFGMALGSISNIFFSRNKEKELQLNVSNNNSHSMKKEIKS